MKKVILIAFYFNQVNEIASKRLRALAKYLPQFGWEPIVIVPDLGFIPKENDDLDCRIIYTEYEDMFSHFSNKFKKSKSIDSNNSNFNDFNDSKESIEFNDEKLKDSSSFSNPIASKAISIAGEIFAYPDGMKYWHESAFKEASNIMDEEEIDAIISSSWPITCHIIAKDLKEHQDIPWIADLRDLWNLNPYVSHTFIRNYFEKRLELKTFENADALTTTTDLAAETLSTLHPMSKIVPILSGYDKDDFKFLEDLISKKDDFSTGFSEKLKFIYAGSLYGGKRDPSYLFEAIRQLEDENKLDSSKISIEFYGDSTDLEEIAKRYGLLDILHIGGKIAHEEVLKKQLDSDVLLLISWDNEKEKMFIPGKIYEYFALKKPVLSIGYKDGSLKDLIEETKVGYHVSNLESTKVALLDIYNEFIEKGTVELRSDINIEDYSMENMAKKFADLLNEL
ncbi:MAG: glycosyl transferase GT4 family protein [Methanobrevibacter sp.]|uniref:glycosyl transferase GT4 family protein n=1 Tax=Methanobrevibacter sp. TaxID=66852 RepID=UPI0025E723C9|nr:glycosyl transferase GT4 family protein [Methanobrevibacter sp.]MBQ6138520.1 glycosyl transferase GT4 family protein [Methanobrevibacter sp.]